MNPRAFASIHFPSGNGGALDALEVTARLHDGHVILTAQNGPGHASVTFSGDPAEVARLLARMQEAAGQAVADAQAVAA